MSRPILYLTNLASWRRTPGHAGPGRRFAAMALPPRGAQGAGKCRAGAPRREDMQAAYRGFLGLEGGITEDEYRQRCQALFQERLDAGLLSPGQLVAKPTAPVVVGDGDGLICLCARPGSPKRRHHCHLETLAPFLVEAGWNVVLYGERVSSQSLSAPAGTDGPTAGASTAGSSSQSLQTTLFGSPS